MSRKRIAVIAVVPASGEKGGAERFHQGLVAALNRYGAETDLVEIVSDEASFETIRETYLRFYDLDLSQYFGVISTKAPAYMLRHPNHICYLQHTMRVFYDMFNVSFPHPTEDILKQRELILKLDTGALSSPRTKEIFVIGKEVKERLVQYNNHPSTVLYQSTTLEGFHCGRFQYIFMPGRLHPWKRVDLLIKAMGYVKAQIKLLISGTGESEHYFKDFAKNDERILFLGRVSDRELIALYADALVVPFVPIREDFGLVTLEAFLSSKPVITCDDSGEPMHIVRDSETGFICKPSPEEIASRLDYLYQNPDVARRMGEQGKASIGHITWQHVAENLMRSLGFYDERR